MSTIEINFGDYVRGVRTTAQGAVLLAARLAQSAPHEMTADEKKALKLVQTRAHEVSVVLGERDRLGPMKLRPYLSSFSNDWTALYEALCAKARLPAHVSTQGTEAQSIGASLFPEGASFTQLDAGTAWVEGDRRLARIDDEELEPRIVHLVGGGFVDAIRKSTAALADVLGAGKEKRPVPSSTALSEAIARFGKAVSAYGRILASRVDEDDDRSLQRFVDAVAPLDVHRATMRTSGDSGDAPDAAADPVEAPHADAPNAPATPRKASGGSTPAPARTTSNGAPAVTPEPPHEDGPSPAPVEDAA